MATRNMAFSILTPERLVVKDQASFIAVTTENGPIGVLPGHIDLLSPTVPGTVRWTVEGEEKQMQVERGFVRVSPSEVTLYAGSVRANGKSEEMNLKK